jgi:hypothetical protein
MDWRLTVEETVCNFETACRDSVLRPEKVGPPILFTEAHVVKQDAFRSRVRRTSPVWLLPFFLAIVASICLAAGLYTLWRHSFSLPSLYRAPAGVLMTALALAQFMIARRLLLRRGVATSQSLHRHPLFWRQLLVGLVVCYGVGLCLGPDPDVRYFFQASLAFWYTVALAPLVITPASIARLSRWTSVRPARLAGKMLFVASLLFVAAEASLRAFDVLTDGRLPALYVARSLKLLPGSQLHGQQVNRLGYWDNDFQPTAEPGIFRIAVLGDDLTLSGTYDSNCVKQLARRVPGVEVYHFGVPTAGPREYSAQLAGEVAQFQPDLVLVFLSIGDDITHEVPLPTIFDWRGLRILQRTAGPRFLASNGLLSFTAGAADMPLNHESYLRSCARRLVVCRTPIDDSMHRRWQQSLAHLDNVVRQCRQQEVPMALILAPGEFQVSRTLCEALRRRAGYGAEELDLELPQRRLAGFADQRQLPVLDLLPHFRAAEISPFGQNAHHWNDHGHSIAADVLSSWLQTRFGAMIAANALGVRE